MVLTILGIILTVVILIFLNALYVAGEFAVVGARKARISQQAQEGNRMAAALMPILENAERLDTTIAASQVGITISSIVLGIYGQSAIAPLIEPLFAGVSGEVAAAGISATVVLLFLTALQVVFGELVPKSVALQFPERMALMTVLPMRWSAEIILRPLIVLLNGSGRLILKWMNIEHGGEHAHVHSPEEILILVRESHQGGLIDADERAMLRSVLRAREVRAGEIGVPRNRIIAAEHTKTASELLKIAATSAYTRILIYEGDLDHIVGFVHLRDLYDAHLNAPDSPLKDIVRPVPFIPETLTTLDAWHRLNEEQSYLAIVFDEFGGTQGMITREDLMEEIFGELQDEFDRERALMTPLPSGRLLLRGDMPISQVNRMLELNLPRDVSLTIGGLIQEKLGRLPDFGDRVAVGDVELRVESVAGRSITTVSLTLPEDHTVHVFTNPDGGGLDGGASDGGDVA